ncbi:unnamed protein product [Arctia plantaginis]|uniref:Uncharacterized protein n=1 Tax=Arctia plantaginis TaxID=874455 RepID=A0A8S0ZLZ8_ARCPL|nr:unnamed protein product [Arctia plantaginis]
MIVGHCCITVESQKSAANEMQRQHNILEEARAREAARASRAEAEAERARSEAAAAGAAGGSVNEGWQTVNYARALKRAPKTPNLNIPPPPPPPAATLAIYPAEGSEIKSAEETKLALKKSKETFKKRFQRLKQRPTKRISDLEEDILKMKAREEVLAYTLKITYQNIRKSVCDNRRSGRTLCKTEMVHWYIDNVEENEEKAASITKLFDASISKYKKVFHYPWESVRFKTGNVSLSRSLVPVNPNNIVYLPKEFIKPSILQTLNLDNMIEYVDVPDYYLDQVDIRSLPNILNYIVSQMDKRFRYLPILKGLSPDFIYISHALLQPQYRAVSLMADSSIDKGQNKSITELCINMLYFCRVNSYSQQGNLLRTLNRTVNCDSVEKQAPQYFILIRSHLKEHILHIQWVVWLMSHLGTPYSRKKGVLTRARARREQEEEVWKPRPSMGMVEQEEGERGERQVTSEQQRGRDADDQYHSVRSGSSDSSPNRHASQESVVANRNKAVHAERARRRAELVAKKRGVAPAKPEARKELLRKYMPELAVKIPKMAHEITQAHLLSSTSSEESCGETTPPITEPVEPSALAPAPPPPSKDSIPFYQIKDFVSSCVKDLAFYR